MSTDARDQNGAQPGAATRRRMSQRVRAFANRRSVWPIATIILIAFALLLFLMWGRPGFFGSGASVAATERPPIGIAATSAIRVDAVGADARGGAPAAHAAPAALDPAFADFYQQRGGLAVFGLPISPPIQVNGRTVQWFERARLELWPELAGTPYAVQSGRLGVEFTQGLSFHQQAPFASRPDLRFFPETGHAVGEPFLGFWALNGGLDAFGYPISEAIPENLSDGQLHTVQYFERARLEQHGDQVLVGLLGSALFTGDPARPAVVTVPPPTPVPPQ